MKQSKLRSILIRVLIVAGVLLAALLIKPALVIPTLKSPTALLIISLMGAGYMLLSSVALPRLIQRVWLREGILWALLGVVALLLMLPYFRNIRVDEPPPIGALRVSAGALQGINHRATGAAALYQQANGERLIRLENLDMQGGPDYDLYVLAGANHEAPGAGINLGDLKGNQGSLSFALPETFQDTGDITVLVWCQFFSVPVANTTLHLQ